MLVTCCYTDDIVVITLNLGSASVSGNNNDIILAMEYTLLIHMYAYLTYVAINTHFPHYITVVIRQTH